MSMLCKSTVCECRQQQTMNCILDTCLLTKLDGRLQSFHDVDADADNWQETTFDSSIREKNAVLNIRTKLYHFLFNCRRHPSKSLSKFSLVYFQAGKLSIPCSCGWEGNCGPGGK